MYRVVFCARNGASESTEGSIGVWWWGGNLAVVYPPPREDYCVVSLSFVAR